MIDATAEVVPRAAADPAIVTAYRERTGWDPGTGGGDWVCILLRPNTIQAWRDVAEITGRTVMRAGAWLA